MGNDTILKLKAYIEECKNRAQASTNAEKKAFFEREIRKTTVKLMGLMQ